MEFDSSIFNDILNKSSKSNSSISNKENYEEIKQEIWNRSKLLYLKIIDLVENKTDRISSRIEKSATTFNDDIFLDIQKLINQGSFKCSYYIDYEKVIMGHLLEIH